MSGKGRHTRKARAWSSDVYSSDLVQKPDLDHFVTQTWAWRYIDLVRFVACLALGINQFTKSLKPCLTRRLPGPRVGSDPFQFDRNGFSLGRLRLLFNFELLILLFQLRGIISLPRNTVPTIQFVYPSCDVVLKITIMCSRYNSAG